eukprot:TRINITY_DN3907_c0_g1_i25.p1 TRINITY_DN3907_c0_g1~~TRINITY_DN3907_c0_g1_i25.p1  ORF type:complete len:370 (-),score=97.81 TRINITY_DN3907_c0_g1_i25:155-1264(-)
MSELGRQQGARYSFEATNSSKQRNIVTGFEEDEMQEIPLKKVDDNKLADKSQEKTKSGFNFINDKPKATEPPKTGDTLEKHVMMYYLQPGGARAKLSNEEKQNFLFKINNLSKESIAQYLNNALSSPDNSVAIKAINFIEAILEARELEYKRLFAPSLQKLTELKSLGIFKSVHSQIAKITKIFTGSKEAQKPLVNTNPISQNRKIVGTDLLDEPKVQSKPNVFEFMKNAEAPKNDLFGNLKLKVPNPVKDSREKAESSFAFMRKKSEKKEELEELDLDFTLGNAPAAKTSDLLDTAFDMLQEPVFAPPSRQGVISQYPPNNPMQPFFNPQLRPQFAQGPRPLPFLTTSNQEEKERAFEKYFDFINEDL